MAYIFAVVVIMDLIQNGHAVYLPIYLFSYEIDFNFQYQ